MTDSLFDYDYFMSLAGTELTAYAEPFVNIHQDLIPESAYDEIGRALDGMDEMHTVYAIEICMLLRPSEFIGRAVEFLAHSSGAVCCAASNTIKRAPKDLITFSIAEKIKSTPIVQIYSEHFRTGERIHHGTNEELIRSLLESD